MGKIKGWTRQHRSVLETLQREGRYRARREFIRMDLQEHAELVLEVYDWLVRNCPDAANRPADVEYPVWVSFRRDATMLPRRRRCWQRWRGTVCTTPVWNTCRKNTARARRYF